MPAFTIGGAQFDRRDEFEVAREGPLGQHPWDPTIHATRHGARFALLAQHTVERLFRDPIEPRGLVHEAPPLRTAGWQRRESAPEIHHSFSGNGVLGHGTASRGLLPEALKPTGGRPGIAGRVFGVAMPQIILDHAEIVAAIGESIAAAMSQHVRMDVKPHASALARNAHQVVDGKARELLAALREEEPRLLDLATLGKIPLESPQLLG